MYAIRSYYVSIQILNILFMKNRRLLNIIPLIIVFLFVQCSSQKLMFKSGTEKDIIGEWHVTSS